MSTAVNSASGVQISVSVDRNPVSMDESFKIYFDAPDSPDGDPDFSPLETDFTVLNQGQSSSSSWINGQYSKSVRWTVEAIAKKPGDLVIPAIAFGSDVSKPLPITVAEEGGANEGDGAAGQDLFLQVKAAPEQPYVQSQVLYTVKLYRRVNIAQASLSEPELQDAVIEKLGEDSNYNTVVNGVSYVVTERKYAIFPQKSGALKIKPLTLTAEVVMDNPRSFSDFFGSQMTKTKRVVSDEVALNVKPAPAGFTGKNWLPAEKLELAQAWSGNTQQMKVGEPLTRTLTLRGAGTTVGQLPELNTVATDANIKAYPDQPVLNEQKSPDGISATRQEKIALIPSASGKQTLPAIEIPWFNTRTNRMETARIPQTTINVIGGSSSSNNNAAPAAELPGKQAPVEKPAISDKIKPVPLQPALDTPSTIWPWLSLFLGLGWLSTTVYFLLKNPKKARIGSEKTGQPEKEEQLKEITRRLKDACNRNDGPAAKEALLAWGRRQFGAGSLGAIAARCEAHLRDEILTLNQMLYGKVAGQWSGKKLFQAFNENKAGMQTKNPSHEQILEPLHRL